MHLESRFNMLVNLVMEYFQLMWPKNNGPIDVFTLNN